MKWFFFSFWAYGTYARCKTFKSTKKSSNMKWNANVLGPCLHYEGWIGNGTVWAVEVKFSWNFPQRSVDRSTLNSESTPLPLDQGHPRTTWNRGPSIVPSVVKHWTQCQGSSDWYYSGKLWWHHFLPKLFLAWFSLHSSKEWPKIPLMIYINEWCTIFNVLHVEKVSSLKYMQSTECTIPHESCVEFT